ncbi:sensor histidine kinase [Phaeacidiphilus oryzae]|uniref:sensor histidine kinase n=1 Tax=Phaeacidiphilus oryzae TaxID=348818 RepID=UPI000A007BF2|nr:HAMP domain-containing sensor histidine kinase [Phaeacidiphilus oryzae]
MTGGTGEEREPGAGQPAEEEQDEVLADREEGRPRQGWFTRRPLRTRLSILTAVAVTIAVALCAFASFFAARSAMIGEVDQTLRQSASGLNNTQDLEHKIQQACTIGAGGGQGIFGAPTTTPTLILADGTVACPSAADDRALQPGSHEIAAAASGTRGPGAVSSYHDGVTRAGTKVRVYVQSVGDLVDRTTGQDIGNAAVAYTQDLGPVTAELRRLAVILIAVAALVIMGAWAAGLFVARTALKPVDRLTEAVEHIARTEEVGTTIPVEGEDEIARLSESFNSMSTALASSRERQSQLIADAGHELRTPLTSLRTNVDLLVRSEESGRDLPVETRSRLIRNMKAQMVELSTLIGDLLQLARPSRPQGSAPLQVVPWHDLVARALDRAKLRGPAITFETDLQPWYVRADPHTLERAVMNLLDNAVKFSPSDGRIDVVLRDGRLTVRDRGPGIPQDELPYVFERFWRSPSARQMPGSGLGLAIVAQTVRDIGGEVTMDRAEPGALAAVVLPGAPTPPPADFAT